MNLEQQLAETLQRIEAARETERCLNFVPNGKQQEVIKAVGEGKKFIVIFSAGNGVGKTALVINILANFIWGPRNEWFEHPMFREFPYPKRIRIVTESKNVEEMGAIDTEITTWWPEGRYTGSKSGKTYVSQYKTDNGWLVDKMTYEQDTREHESATLGVGVFDEPPPEDKYSAMVSRMRQGGIIIMPMTPLTNAAWIFDRLIDSPTEDTVTIFADVEDNCKVHGIRGILEHEHIEKMINNMDADEVDARAHGRSMHLSNVILKNAFDRDVHLIDDDIQPPKGCQFGTVIDPASGKPWAMGFFWVDARGQVVFDDEYPHEDWVRQKESHLTAKDYVNAIRFVENKKPIEWRILDRHYGNARDDYGSTLKVELADKFGMDCMDSYNCENEIETGILTLKGYLRADPILKAPKVLFKKRCRNITRALERWSRDPKTLTPNRLSPYKDHFDLVRYVCGARLEVFHYKPLPQFKPKYVLGR